MKQSFSLNLLLAIVFTLFTQFIVAQVNLLPHIGLEEQPAPSDVMCETPLYLVDYAEIGFLENDTVNDFTLYATDNSTYNLGQALNAGRPALLISSSYTCPRFRDNIALINSLENAYPGIDIVVVYTVEAHPLNDVSPYSGFINTTPDNLEDDVLFDQPDIYQDRLDVIYQMQNDFDIDFKIYPDGTCNEWLEVFGPAPNIAYLVNTDGTVFSRHTWLNFFPNNMESDVEDLLLLLEGEEEEEEEEEQYLGSFTFELTDGNYSEGLPNSPLFCYGTLTNNTEDPVLIEVERFDVDMPEGWTHAMCLDVCLSIYDDNYLFVLEPGESQLYINHFYTTSADGTGSVNVRFKNTNDEGNEIVQNFLGTTIHPISVNENLDQVELNFYPNPTSDILNFSNNENVNLILMNSIGQVVLNIPANTNNVSLDHLNAGIYTILDSKTSGFKQRIIIQ